MIIPPRRLYDKWGSGKYGASRGGNKTHKGEDQACLPRSILLSDVDGTISSAGIVYEDDHQYKIINIRVNIQVNVRYFYVEQHSSLLQGTKIKRHDSIGIVQDISLRYPGITPHYHLQVEIEGVPVNPARWLKEYVKRYKE